MKQCDTLEKMIELSSDDRERAGKVVARSFFRILARNGFSHSDIMNFAGNLLDEVMRDMRAKAGDGVSVPHAVDDRDVA
ncbi:MAG: hypothetical protein P1S46_09665 [bacterium]|nr:hypothetical protein [bacterium]MDT8396303.1 hypothetical protein [bacterium]